MQDQSKTSAHNSPPSGRWVCGLALAAMIVCGAMLFRSPTVAPLENVTTKPAPTISETMTVSGNKSHPDEATIRLHDTIRFVLAIDSFLYGNSMPLNMPGFIRYYHYRSHPVYSNWRGIRSRQLIFHSEDLRRVPEIWERAWGMKMPDATPYRVHGGVI